MEAQRYQLYVEGKWVDADGGRTFEVRDPATGDHVADIADAGAAETRRGIQAAHRAFPGWAATPAKQRGETLRKIQALMQERVDDIAKLVVLENGRPQDVYPHEEGGTIVTIKEYLSKLAKGAAGAGAGAACWAAAGVPSIQTAATRTSIPSTQVREYDRIVSPPCDLSLSPYSMERACPGRGKARVG